MAHPESTTTTAAARCASQTNLFFALPAGTNYQTSFEAHEGGPDPAWFAPWRIQPISAILRSETFAVAQEVRFHARQGSLRAEEVNRSACHTAKVLTTAYEPLHLCEQLYTTTRQSSWAS